MLDDITQPMPFTQLPALSLLPKLHDPFLTSPTSIAYDQPQEVDALVKRCEASLRRLSTLTHSFQPIGNMSTVTILPNKVDYPYDDYKKPQAIISVQEVEEDASDVVRPNSNRKSKPSSVDARARKWKVSKPTRPIASRTNSGLSKKSSAPDYISDDVRSKESCDTAMRSKTTVATSFCDVVMVENSMASPKRSIPPLTELPPINKPDDSNICSLLHAGITNNDEVLTQSCINHLRQGAVFHPLITIKACAPFACDRPNVPQIITLQIRPILHEAVRTLLDDYPDYDCGEPSPRWTEYLNSVPVQLQQLFSAEWCRYVRRIKSFHENSPWDDFDYEHTTSCPHKDSCELYTRIQIRDAWNQFWKESILSGNRCVPKPSQVAQFLCTYGNDLTGSKLSHTNQPNINCVAGFKEELAQTLECLGGDNARYNWRWLGENLFKQKR